MKIAKRISLPGVLTMTAMLIYAFLAVQSNTGGWHIFCLGKHA
jgi:hypothetical protein